MTWSWHYSLANGEPVVVLPSVAVSTAFPSQVEAEAWIGEAWRDLVDAGIDAVTLVDGDRVVYGPMSLHPAG